MNEKLIRLAERRERLIAQAAAQRLALAQNIEPWRAPLARADQGLAVLRYLKGHPAWIVGGIALLAALRPGRVSAAGIGKWLTRGWATWQMVRKLRGR
ncbi:MAG: YqjK-like family protein [Thiobacillus sp.]|nr:YqjK-like family protein [Thiobacillus sp.]